MIQDSLSVLCWIGPTYERRLGSSSGMEGKRRERKRNPRNIDKFYLVNNTMHVAAQWPFLQADYPSQSLCYIKKRGKNRAPKKRKGGLYSSNQCCPLCCLTFEGLVINDCWLLYLNVSPQLPGTALIGSGTCRWPQPIPLPPNSPTHLAVRGWAASVTPPLACLHLPHGGGRGDRKIAPTSPLPNQLLLCFFLKEEEGKKKRQRPKLNKN